MPTSTLVASDPERIRHDLVDGIRRTNDVRRRRNTRALGSIGVLLVALVGVTAWTLSTSEPAYALRQTPQGVIEVEIYPAFDDVEALQGELAAAGVEALVVPLRGHPSLHGLVEVVSHGGESQGAVTRSFDGHRLELDPTEITETVEILIYSAARHGETYQFAPSVFAPGQPLAGLPCALTDRPLTSAEIQTRAASVGLDQIKWVFFSTRGPSEVGTGLEARPEGIVVEAQLASVDTLRVIVAPAVGNEEPAAENFAATDGSHRAPTRIGCTPELAAAWD